MASNRIDYSKATHIDFFKGQTLVRNAKVNRFINPGTGPSFKAYILEDGTKVRVIDVACFTLAK
jgi:hypothetical protein